MPEEKFKVGLDGNDKVFSCKIADDALACFGIFRGDVLHVETIEQNDAEQLTAWAVDSEFIIGFASVTSAGVSITRVYDRKVFTVEKSRTKLIGKVVAYTRAFDARNFTPQTAGFLDLSRTNARVL